MLIIIYLKYFSTYFLCAQMDCAHVLASLCHRKRSSKCYFNSLLMNIHHYRRRWESSSLMASTALVVLKLPAGQLKLTSLWDAEYVGSNPTCFTNTEVNCRLLHSFGK